METYTLPLYCNNCGHVDQYEIDKGVRITKAACSNCGLHSLTKQVSWGKYTYTVQQYLDRYKGDDDDEGTDDV